MLWDASAINGYAIEASDGRLGTVSDLLFEDVELDHSMAGCRHRQLAPRSESPSAAFGPGAARSGLAPLPRQTDHATSQGQSGCRHGSACVAADRSPMSTIITVGTPIGAAASFQ